MMLEEIHSYGGYFENKICAWQEKQEKVE